MIPFGRAGIVPFDPAGASFAPPSGRRLGNDLPPWTGSRPGPLAKAAPSPRARAGYTVDGQVGDPQGYLGTDPSRPHMSPARHLVLGAEQENWNRRGIIGFNDQLQVRDRHVYWDTGNQRSGLQQSVPGNPPNNHSDGPPQPDLRAVNISVNPQIGSSHTRNQDDLSRPYTWLGQQDGTVQPVYGGVKGLYQPYGTRGGVPYPIVDPTNGAGGLEQVTSGPPHGLHSDTIPSGKQVADRYKANPQMRPVRFDRPDNSRIGGQSYSQTVQPQAATGPVAPGATGAVAPGASFSVRVGSRGWSA